MSNSRRGPLAAALVAVVVGSIGLASTLNAMAEEVPEPAPVTESSAAVPDASPGVSPEAVPGTSPEASPEDLEVSPPPKLPWGKVPTEIDTGADGATSQQLSSRGLDAAAPDSDGEPAGDEYAPKGRSAEDGTLRSQPTDVVPPKPPAAASSVQSSTMKGLSSTTQGLSSTTVGKATQTVYFLYNVGSQDAVTDGAYANFTISKPTLAASDYHTLAELAVQSANGNQIVEVGWNVDQVVNGDADPHLFVYHWVNGQPGCYNSCGFVQYSQNVSPGDTLPQNATKRLGIQYYDGAWWIAYDTEWVGYFPGSLWNNTFTQSGTIQAFGEVAAASTAPCTAMGNGLNGNSNSSAARIGSISFINGPTVDMYVRSTSDYYDVAKLTGRTFRYGGPGAC